MKDGGETIKQVYSSLLKNNFVPQQPYKQHWIPHQSKTFIQTLLEKLQCIKRCSEVSKFELQKTHEACVADKTVR